VAVLGVGTAQAGQEAPGIWTYNCTLTFTLFNFTNYELKTVATTLSTDGICDGCAANVLRNVVVEPFRTYKQECTNGQFMVPCNWHGAVTLQAQPLGGGNTLRDWAFDIVFEDQNAHNLAEEGSWVYLMPHSPDQGWSIPSSTDTWAYGRWATTINDLKMHNIMTLIGPKVMVALYSPDNKNIVIVVQQYWENAAGWDDSKHWKGWQLDWVDNDGSTVPR